MRAGDRMLGFLGNEVTDTSDGWWASDRSQIPAGATVMNKTHGVATISWPTSS